jgi:hypothetical protein
MFMKLIPVALLTAATCALAAVPAGAAAPTTTHAKPTGAKAYGTYCKNQSKKHVAGQKGTPFSQCVTAMAKLDKGAATTAKAACKPLSKKHVAGVKGTPYSRCIVAAAQLLKDKKAADVATTTPAPTTTPTTTPTTEPTTTTTTA